MEMKIGIRIGACKFAFTAGFASLAVSVFFSAFLCAPNARAEKKALPPSRRAGSSPNLSAATNVPSTITNPVAPSLSALIPTPVPNTGLTMELFYDNSIDTADYTVLRAFLRANRSVIWQRASLNGVPLSQDSKTSILDWFPSSRCLPNQTCELNVVLRGKLKGDLRLEVESQDYQRIQATLPAAHRAKTRIRAVCFDAQLQQMLLAYDFRRSRVEEDGRVQGVWINDEDHTDQMRLLQTSTALDGEPGLVWVKLKQPLRPTQWVDVRLTVNGHRACALLRGDNRISLDSFNLTETPKDQPLRSSLNLDAAPLYRFLPAADVCCEEHTAGKFGHSLSRVATTRQSWVAAEQAGKAAPRIEFLHFCTPMTGSHLLAYSRATSALGIASYSMGYSTATDPHWMEREERRLAQTARVARSGVIWIPEAFSRNGQWVAPEELRWLSVCAMAYARGIKWFIYQDLPGLQGYNRIPALKQEIAQINAHWKALAPWIGTSLLLGVERQGFGGTGVPACDAPQMGGGVTVTRSWSFGPGGAGGLFVIVRNRDCVSRVRETAGAPQRLKAESPWEGRFEVRAQERMWITVAKPEWLRVGRVQDPRTGEALAWKETAQGIEVEIGRLELSRLIWIENAAPPVLTAEVFEHFQESAAADDPRTAARFSNR